MVKEEYRSDNRGFSFKGDNQRWYLVRCHNCKMENWAPAIATGICCWCGYDDNQREISNDTNSITNSVTS